MKSSRNFRFMFILAGLTFLLASCGSGSTTPTPTPTNPTGSTVPATNTPPVSPTVTTVAVPPTQTSCPAAGTARAWVTAPLALGSHQNVVYLVSEYHGNVTTNTLKRYDLTIGNKTEIVKLPGVYISEAQVSADGQWLLFVSRVNQQAILQMVRMDGQGLQTLYCVANGDITHVLLSANEQSVLFNLSTSPQGPAGISLLNLKSAKIQLEVQPGDSGSPLHLKFVGTLVTWLDNTRAYVRFSNFPIAPDDSLGLLDTGRGPNQKMSDLTTVFQQKFSPPFNYPCWDADSSFDGSTLFVSQCSGISAPNCSGSCLLGTREGPSTINTEPASGGSLKTILISQKLGIGAVRAISSGTLLLQIENFSVNHPIDPSQNGFWKVNTDGTNLTRLTTEVKGTTASLCQYSQNPWSSVSRDGTMYAFQTLTRGSYPETYTLSTAPLNGGTPQSFASIADGTQLSIVGWTTM